VTSPAAAAELRQRLERRDAIVGVVAFAKAAGLSVVEVDADDARVERIGRGPLGAQPHVIRL
jgi:hypothetical protein